MLRSLLCIYICCRDQEMIREKETLLVYFFIERLSSRIEPSAVPDRLKCLYISFDGFKTCYIYNSIYIYVLHPSDRLVKLITQPVLFAYSTYTPQSYRIRKDTISKTRL